MTPLRILFFGLMTVGVMLYVLNPGPEKFEQFLRTDLAERAEAATREATGDDGGRPRPSPPASQRRRQVDPDTDS